MKEQPLWDVVVVGAGPGGSTAAARLAQHGVAVLVLEKDAFPRFHIGESLLPSVCEVLQRLSVVPDPNAFVFKRGAQFVSERSGRVAGFDFAEALPGPPRHAYHVERARFDQLLRDRAAELGADIRHGVRVRGVELEPHRVCIRTDSDTVHARYVIDATGQDRLLGRQLQAIEPYRAFGKAASFVHFDDVRSETIAQFAPENDIRVMLVDEGWAWIIPLAGDRLSVGLVSRSKGLPQDAVLAYAQASPLLSHWTRGAVASQPRLVGNFSFRNTRSRGPRFACIGDAACFIDPVFSSGVSLAMQSAWALSERLIPALAADREGDAELAAPHEAEMKRAYDTFGTLVYRFYNTRFAENFILGAPAAGSMRASVTSVLAGDVLRADNPFRDMLLASRIKHDHPVDPEKVAS